MTRILRVPVWVLIALFAFGFVSCSDDDDPAGPGGESDPDIVTLNAMINSVVTPLAQHVFLGAHIAQGGNASGAGQSCEPLNICSSGSAEVCTSPGSFQLNFVSCQIGSQTLTGTVNLTTEQNSGSGTVSLNVGSTTMSGTLSYTMDKTCFSQIFTDFTITASGQEINMAGSSSWCTPYAMIGGNVIPTFANFEFVVPSADRLLDVAIFSEPVGSMEAVVLNANRTKILKVCHSTFTQGNPSCTDGPDA